jgi:hypothetical protein
VQDLRGILDADNKDLEGWLETVVDILPKMTNVQNASGNNSLDKPMTMLVGDILDLNTTLIGDKSSMDLIGKSTDTIDISQTRLGVNEEAPLNIMS